MCDVRGVAAAAAAVATAAIVAAFAAAAAVAAAANLLWIAASTPMRVHAVCEVRVCSDVVR